MRTADTVNRSVRYKGGSNLGQLPLDHHCLDMVNGMNVLHAVNDDFADLQGCGHAQNYIGRIRSNRLSI